MGLKPLPARWFEALAARNDLSRLVEALARSGGVQIEVEHEVRELGRSPELAALFEEYDRLARRYARYWPDGVRPLRGVPGSPVEVASRALEKLRAFGAKAEPLVTELEDLARERADLLLLHELFEAAPDRLPDPSLLSSAGPTLAVRLYTLDAEQYRRLALPEPILVQRISGKHRIFLVVTGPAASYASAERALLAVKARPIDIPSFICAGSEAPLTNIQRRLAELDARIMADRGELQTLARAHELSGVLSDLERLRWFFDNVPRLPETRHFALVTGWTSDRSGALLHRVLERSGLIALIRFPPPPAGCLPPTVLYNPRWAKPFEAFLRLLGTPARHEPDPSLLLGILAPLLFGYMFGDVGQGLLLLGLGIALRRRFPALRMLVLGGSAAILFGLLFGSIFALDVIPALWLRPLSEPLVVLAVAVVAGAAVLLIGLFLSGLEAYWRGELGRWLRTDAALIVVYTGLLGAAFRPSSGVIALVATVWFVIGSATVAPKRRMTAMLGALGQLFERIPRLFVNTISFARVGAFALAHAGLSAAIAALSASSVNRVTALAVLVFGNVLAVALEGLVVSIQTTRLVLFEFFARFLRAEGRRFQPLVPPPCPPAAALQGAEQS